MNFKLAYVFYDDGGPLSSEEHELLLKFLQEKELDIHKENWDDASVDWNQYQCIVLKSPWDYIFKTGLFYEWLEKTKNILMLNSADIVKWNSDKHYLQEIEAAGLKIIPTKFIEPGEPFEPGFTGTLIVKPCISSSSKNTFKISSADPLPNELHNESIMVQPFIPQINEEGEWSLVFLGGKFSHALTKTPAKDDFRCQPEFGGVIELKDPAPHILQAATEYVSQFAKECLYARIDGLIIDNEFYLMELELIDPYLFLSIYPPAYENYFQALVTMV